MADFRLRRIVLAGLAAGLLAVPFGGALELARLGTSDRAAFARVEGDVRARFNDIMTALRSASASVARPDLLETAPASAAAGRALMDAADAALRARPRDIVAVTAFGAKFEPLGWSGRPSDFLSERLAGPETFFVTPGPLGHRLVHILPVSDPSHTRRVGTIATEWALTGPAGGRGPLESLSFDSLVPVSLRPQSQGAGESREANIFVITDPKGDLLFEATVSSDDLKAARLGWRRGIANVVLTIVALTLVLSTGSLLQRRRRAPTKTAYVRLTAAVTGVLVLARTALWFALAGPWTQPALFPAPPANIISALFLRSAIDLLLTAIFCLGVVALLSGAIERWRLARRERRISWQRNVRMLVPFALTQLAAGALVAAIIGRYQRFIANALTGTPVNVAHFSLHPLDVQRLALAVGLIALHAAIIWSAVLLLRAAVIPWRIPWRAVSVNGLLVACWLVGVLILVVANRVAPPVGQLVWGMGATMLLALAIGRGRARYRHASQGLRLIWGGLAVIVPALVMYPVVLNVATRAIHRIIETDFGPEALLQRARIQERVRRSREQIDRLEVLGDLVEDLAKARGPASSRAAYAIWADTDLAERLLTSSVELYGPDGSLVSRFAFNLPEENPIVGEPWKQKECDWVENEEVSPFGSEERRLLFSARGLCRPDKRYAGYIVIRAMPDYDALPFISAQRLPYELLYPNQPQRQEGVSGEDVEFVVYGWSRRPIYTSTGSSWLFDDSTFDRLTVSRNPFWVVARNHGREYEVYLLSDRAGIYAIGYPRLTPLEHIINLAEAAVLAALLYALILAAATLFSMATGFGPASGRALLREIRASFYRKLFLAFVLVSFLPVAILAVATHLFFAAQARSTLEAAAVQTAATAQRVIEDYSTLIRRDAAGVPNWDDLMVWISRAIDQDVNIFEGPSLRATSERFLFESRLLPERTPSGVYRAIALDRRSSFVDQVAIGESPYMIAATPVRLGSRTAILTMPLTLRQKETEDQIDALDRRVLLGAVVFILLGAAIGYSIAERIADPVNRLTRATRRIARGDLDARILETSSDELRTLIAAFNRMAAELSHQRAELERTHRIAAWAEMARQVAHEIKNPLTPIQLSAEHLLRLHLDRGKPLTPILEECLTVILSQVRLLRQIASEFSAFASSPTPRPIPTSLAELIHEVVVPYRTGLSEQIRITEAVSDDLPLVNLDRTLFARALTNVIENALHAMPKGGSIALTAGRVDSRVRLSISDTGEGMDAEALQRVFEPYFSTKTSGTGLGLPIAKRNVELNGGTIAVESGKGVGTTVTIELPIEQ